MWLLQFIGPVKSEWMAALGAEGVVLVQYIPYHAYIAAATEQQIRRIAALPYVQWSMRMHRFLKPAPSSLEPGSYFGAVLVLADTAQTGEAIAALSDLSRRPVEVRRFSPAELQLFGVYRVEDLDYLLSQPLVWGIAHGYHDGNVSDIPALSGVALCALAVTLAFVGAFSRASGR